MSVPPVRLLPNGDTALAVEFGERIDRATSERVLALHDRLAHAGLAGVVELLSTFRSLMVHYDPQRTSHAELAHAIAPLLEGLEGVHPAARRWTIPVCYDPAFALDLGEVAARTGLAPAEVIEQHSGTTYHVYMIGFLPGYPYMGDVPARLALPRRENPRTQVPAGSVAIATTMTAVYTLASPGGWHILGRTPVPLWSKRRNPPAVLAPGDKVRFAPIGMTEFERLAQRAAAGELALEAEDT
ncbi:MAG TPA: 5-oxoprolinase subunit PxpB [Burkholderiales bacterium]|nr:5-oxoprolinase subunit PxpB [Burkholderiales bacterium]